MSAIFARETKCKGYDARGTGEDWCTVEVTTDYFLVNTVKDDSTFEIPLGKLRARLGSRPKQTSLVALTRLDSEP